MVEKNQDQGTKLHKLEFRAEMDPAARRSPTKFSTDGAWWLGMPVGEFSAPS